MAAVESLMKLLTADDPYGGDVTALASLRQQFVEGDEDQVDRYCERLAAHLGVDRPLSSGQSLRTPPEIVEQVDVLRHLAPSYRIFGACDGTGLVIRSRDPVEFPLSRKTVNVVPVRSVEGAVQFATVATQTVGVYPPSCRPRLRDALASAGVQRLVPLGAAASFNAGLPHDAMYPLHRLMRWVVDEDTGSATTER